MQVHLSVRRCRLLPWQLKAADVSNRIDRSSTQQQLNPAVFTSNWFGFPFLRFGWLQKASSGGRRHSEAKKSTVNNIKMNNLTPGLPKATGGAPTVFCYICGRQFGSRSIGIHQPQCLKKWEAENDKLPKHLRRPAPQKPEIIKKGGKVDVEATNQAAWEASQSAMVECANCGRRFNPDRLAVHNRSCTPDNPAKRVGTK
uniref:Zinc finger protein 474 n=1 Tax=Plectus sambesii TaxID=2011161 RepID=A0A914XEZ1_9BILA